MTPHPQPLMLLPGVWTQARVLDADARAAFRRLLHEAVGDHTADAVMARVDELVAADLTIALADTNPTTPTVILVCWPTGSEGALPTGVAALRDRLPADVTDVVELESDRGYAVVRERQVTGTPATLRYWLTHPHTGRLLYVEVLDLRDREAAAADDDFVATFDDVVESTVWKDPDAAP